MIDLPGLQLSMHVAEASVVAYGPGEFALRLGIAAVAGLMVGLEREVRRRPAGLRTHMLVAVGSCTVLLVALDLHAHQVAAGESQHWDVLRVVSGVVQGVGFLGAGAIIQGRGEVRGLTTAAGIWVVAALGLTAAIANLALLGIVLGITLFTLVVLRFVERRLLGSRDDAEQDPDARRPGARDA